MGVWTIPHIFNMVHTRVCVGRGIVSVPDRSALFFIYHMDRQKRSGNIAYQKLCHAHKIVCPIRLQNAWSTHGKCKLAGPELLYVDHIDQNVFFSLLVNT